MNLQNIGYKYTGNYNRGDQWEKGNDTLRLMIGVPCPMKGTAYIFATPDEVENLQCAFPYPYEIKSKED